MSDYERLKESAKKGILGNNVATRQLNPDGWNILAVIHDKVSACEEYRVFQPLIELEKKGHNIIIMNASELDRRHKEKIDDFQGAHLILFNRIVAREMDIGIYDRVVGDARDRGAAVIVDFDDQWKNDYRQVHPGVFPSLKKFSAITVTTPYLKSYYSGENKHIYVLPNYINTKHFVGGKRDIPFTTIGLTGSITHMKDWEVAAEAFLELAPRHPDVRLFVSGCMPEKLKGHPQVLTPGMVRPDLSDGLLVKYPDMGWLMNQIDILWCPVDPDDKFNYGKSGLKAIEGMAAGCAVIATGGKLPIYREVITHGVSGILAEHNKEEYIYYTEYLLDHPEVKNRMLHHGMDKARQLDISQHVRERVDVYGLVIGRQQRWNSRSSRL